MSKPKLKEGDYCIFKSEKEILSNSTEYLPLYSRSRRLLLKYKNSRHQSYNGQLTKNLLKKHKNTIFKLAYVNNGSGNHSYIALGSKNKWSERLVIPSQFFARLDMKTTERKKEIFVLDIYEKIRESFYRLTPSIRTYLIEYLNQWIDTEDINKMNILIRDLKERFDISIWEGYIPTFSRYVSSILEKYNQE